MIIESLIRNHHHGRRLRVGVTVKAQFTGKSRLSGDIVCHWPGRRLSIMPMMPVMASGIEGQRLGMPDSHGPFKLELGSLADRL